MKLVKIFVLILHLGLVLTGCEIDSPDNTIGSHHSFAPESLESLGFSLTIEQGSGFSGKEILPEFDDRLGLQFNDHDVFIKSDRYDEWQFSYSYQFYHDDNQILVKLNNEQVNIDITLGFASQDTGTWQIGFQDQGKVFNASGTFFYSKIDSPVDHAYQGQVLYKQQIYSDINDFHYPYRVYLPSQYFTEPDKRFPIVYATDGQWVFWEFSRFLDIQQYPVILVAIEQGKDNRREVDYLLPGSAAYLSFFKQEFIPEVERHLRVDVSNRSVQGASYGGLVVSHFLIDHQQTPSFQNYISADGAYWYSVNNYRSLEQSANLEITSDDPVTLYLSSATNGGNHPYVASYHARLTSLEIENLVIENKAYNLTHVEIALPSFKDSIEQIFGSKN